ncbi:feather keratin 1-like [Patagioenas fasciata monilis]|uniref:Feather keratin 1-like n=1 Tax=Patagioenas fasciata monilis TaxID=372326 RepID=A0A1V4L107_PATFA|nr:feather keratin 1-like [Patagioenas fasciata monilis]
MVHKVFLTREPKPSVIYSLWRIRQIEMLGEGLRSTAITKSYIRKRLSGAGQQETTGTHGPEKKAGEDDDISWPSFQRAQTGTVIPTLLYRKAPSSTSLAFSSLVNKVNLHPAVMSCYDLCRPCGPTPLANSCNEPCVRQCQDSRVIIEPSPVVVTLPGPILSSFPQNTAVGSSTSAAVGSILSEQGVPINSGGFSLGGLGGLGGRSYGRRIEGKAES